MEDQPLIDELVKLDKRKMVGERKKKKQREGEKVRQGGLEFHKQRETEKERNK